MELGAFPSSSCFPARRNPVCPSFVLLAVLRLDALATDAGQIHSKGDKEGRERETQSPKEGRRVREFQGRKAETQVQIHVRGGRKPARDRDRLRWAKGGERQSSTAGEKGRGEGSGTHRGKARGRARKRNAEQDPRKGTGS